MITSNASIDDIRKNILKPPSNEVILDWYRSKELPKNAGLESNNKAADWFHGRRKFGMYWFGILE